MCIRDRPSTDLDIAIQRLDPGLPLPAYAHPGDAGADLHAAHDVTLAPGERALVGTGLDVWLTQQGIGQIVISGIRTEQCCETTTRHASDLGWQVVFVPEATLTFDMALPDGSPFRAADIRARSARRRIRGGR